MDWIDLRSDTVSHPTPEIREAMAKAEVGDDVYGEDPSINRLEEVAALRMGKQAGLFVPSGTMGNLAAILTHCGRGDEMILGELSHIFLNEAGGASALGGVHPRTLPTQNDGTLHLDAIEEAIRGDDPHFPRTRLICLENTHNRCGGAPISLDYTQEVGEIARRHGLRLHMDGARIFNAAAALSVDAAKLVEVADSVTFCLSKGLCAPVGSVLCGETSFIAEARRVRKLLGGGMRQAGVIAAAGLVALNSMLDRLVDDHVRARALAEGLRGLKGLKLEDDPPPTNMVYLNLAPEAAMSGDSLAEALAERKIKIHVVGGNRIRLVTHYWIDDKAVEKTVDAFTEALGRGE
jgi:threonine aldolase